MANQAAVAQAVADQEAELDPTDDPSDVRYLPRDRFGRVLNKATGYWVQAKGKVGSEILRKHRAALQAEGVVLPYGAIGTSKPVEATPGDVEASTTSRFFETKQTERRFGAFISQTFTLEAPSRTVAEFAKTVWDSYEKVPPANRLQVIIQLVAGDGSRKARTIVMPKNRVDLAGLIDKVQGKGEAIEKSDAVDAEFVLDTSIFKVGSIQRPAGGLKLHDLKALKGPVHPHFRLTDFPDKKQDGNCLLAVLRGVAGALARERGVKLKLPRNAGLRKEMQIPPSPALIVACPEVIDKLARKFELRVRVITGMSVPPDSERKFDDNPARTCERNRCTTVAVPLIIAEGGDESAALCDVFLDNNHYTLITGYHHVNTCPITGDISTGAPQSVDAVARRVIAQGRPWYAGACEEARQAAVSAALSESTKTKYREHVIVFDYETTYNKGTGELDPYALGYLVFDPDTHSADFAGDAAQVSQIFRKLGDNRLQSTQPLLELLCAAPADVRYTLVSFNGARFDHYLLAWAANARDILTSVFATSAGGIRSLKIGRHSTLDLAKLCPGTSLKDACKGFKTSPTKMEGFDHKIPQEARDNRRLYAWMDANRAELSAYLTRDILSTASLFVLLRKTLKELCNADCIGPRAIGTIGGFAWERMNAVCELPSAVVEESTDRCIRAAITGGRVQSYTEKHAEKKLIIPEARMVDFVSLYPTVMAAVPSAAALFKPSDRWGAYPSAPGVTQLRAAIAAEKSDSGKKALRKQLGALKLNSGAPTPVADYYPDDVGIYDCTIYEQPPGLPNVVPRRTPGEPLDWQYRGEMFARITHIEIAMIREFGGRVQVHQGLVWRTHTTGLFAPYVNSLAAIKDEQDQLVKKDDPAANPALRAVVKLLLNSASGKCCQANYDEKVALARGTSAQLAADAKMRQDSPRTWIPLGGDTCLIVGKKDETKVYTKKAKPSILAVLIYSYSRALVWRTICQHNVLYSDTDSGLFMKADYERLRAAFPGLDPTGRKKKLGDLEQELADHEIALVYRMAPKDYAIFLCTDGKLLQKEKEEDKDIHKIRMKGVHQGSDRLLSVEGAKMMAKANLYERSVEYVSPVSSFSKPLKTLEVAVEMYERRAAGEKVTVLCSQIRRGTFDESSPFSLKQRFLLKEL